MSLSDGATGFALGWKAYMSGICAGGVAAVRNWRVIFCDASQVFNGNWARCTDFQINCWPWVLLRRAARRALNFGSVEVEARRVAALSGKEVGGG